ncbi:MAG: RNA methyltransferase [Acidimicrobiales bacterium]|nr:RNA methyltransferase [Acidimicrobiales bacterium]
MEAIRIDDPDDERLDDYRTLTDPELRKRYEGERGVFIVESPLAVEALAGSPHAGATRSVLVGERRLARMAPVLAALTDLGATLYTAPAEVLEATAGFALHRGVVAAVDRPDPVSPIELTSSAGLVLAVEGVNDHENLGALFRNAAAFGVDAVLLDPTCADPWYRRSVRVSMGHVLAVPHARTGPWPDGLLAATGDARVLALAPAGKTTVASLRPRSGPVVLAVGAEGPGLTDAVLAHPAIETVRIPMARGVDSLNVATAAAVALSHLTASRIGEG